MCVGIEAFGLLFSGVCLAYMGFQVHMWLRRRAAFREFALARGLRFRGTILTERRVPYAVFGFVCKATMVYHAVEGPLNGFDVAVFDVPRKGGTVTGAIVSGLPVTDAPAPPRDGELWFDLQDGHLLGIRAYMSIEDVPAFLESVVSVARRLPGEPDPREAPARL